MSFEFFIRKHIALGQKPKNDPSLYGQGFNYLVEVGFGGEESNEEELVNKTLKQIDHQLLGVDSDLVTDPTTANICRWIFFQLSKERHFRLIEVRLFRGDGLSAVMDSCKVEQNPVRPSVDNPAQFSVPD